ncbi:MAG TPA: hypothetical protein VFO77_11425, partial [Actinoplanes sp.]|nr:hypothetical protein [Actinoplanes sp.]
PPGPSYGQPYPSPPQPGQPQPGQPQPGHPQAEQPYQGQPYPGQPQPGPGGVPGGYPPVAKKSNVLKIVLIVLAVILVLCIGGVVATVFFVKNAADEITKNDPGAAPATPARKITLVEPATLGGRPKQTAPEFAGAVATLKQSLAGAPGATGTVGALYGDPADRDLIMIAGASAPLSNPAKELDETLDGASSSGLVITDVVTVDPGPLGGQAKCGNSSTSGIDLAICAWADSGSVGMIAAYFKSVEDIKPDFVDLRGEIEKVS